MKPRTRPIWLLLIALLGGCVIAYREHRSLVIKVGERDETKAAEQSRAAEKRP